jgi:polysaccharide biosynthesis protein PslH
MRILFHSLALPYPATNGYKMRTWSLLQALAAEGHEITLVCFATSQEAAEDIRPLTALCRSVEIVPQRVSSMSSRPDLRGRARALVGPLPYGVVRFRSETMRRVLAGHIQIRAFDLIFTETSYSLINLPVSSHIPIVLDNHNVEYLLLERYIRHARTPLHRAYARIESHRMRQWDQAACMRASLVLVCSQHDRDLLRDLCPRVQCTVVPNTIDAASYHSAPDSEEPVVLYTGGMDWYPNRDAVQFFAQEILPNVRRRVPGVRFLVAGRNPSEGFRRLMSQFPGVELTGTVSDMRQMIGKAAVCVVPLRIGSGTRLKILEAAAMAKPVVSTRLGAEGLEFADGKEIVLKDAPESFAEATSSLLLDPSRRRALGQAARARVEEMYSFPVLRRRLRQALLRVCESSCHGSKEKLTEMAWEGAEP